MMMKTTNIILSITKQQEQDLRQLATPQTSVHTILGTVVLLALTELPDDPSAFKDVLGDYVAQHANDVSSYAIEVPRAAPELIKTVAAELALEPEQMGIALVYLAFGSIGRDLLAQRSTIVN